MFTTQFWLIVIGIAQMIGCSWIFSKFQKRTYKREIRSRHSYVLLAKLLAEEENLDAIYDTTRNNKGVFSWK